MTTQTQTLRAVNTALHEVLDASWVAAMEALTALDHAEALRHWTVYAERLEAHAALEDARSLPPYAALSEHARAGSPGIFANEHTKLGRLVREGVALIAGLDMDGPNARRQMIEVLDRLLLPRNVLEHHTLRENEHLYPTLERVLDGEEAEELRQAMKAQLAGWDAQPEPRG